MGSLYLGGPTIQEVDGKMMMGLSIYGVAVISGSLYSRFYGISCPIPYIDSSQPALNWKRVQYLYNSAPAKELVLRSPRLTHIV